MDRKSKVLCLSAMAFTCALVACGFGQIGIIPAWMAAGFCFGRSSVLSWKWLPADSGG